MKKLLFMLLAVAALVSCESEYDKMSEYEKVIYDVGTSSAISAEDALKNVEVWKAVKIISSTEAGGRGKVSVSDYENTVYYGAPQYYFSYGSMFRLFVNHGPDITMYDKGIDNPYVIYQSYYVGYNYKLNTDNSITVSVNTELEDLLKKYGKSINKMHLVAYNETCIVVEIHYDISYEYKYVTYVLKPTTISIDDMTYHDIETFDKQ